MNIYGWTNSCLIFSGCSSRQFLSAPDKDKLNLLSDNLKLVNTAIGEEDNLVRYASNEIIACLNLSKRF